MAISRKEDESWAPTGWVDSTNRAEDSLLPYLALGFRPQPTPQCCGRLAGCTALAMSLWAVQDLTRPKSADRIPDEDRWTAQRLYALFDEEAYKEHVEFLLSTADNWRDLTESSREDKKRAGVQEEQLPSQQDTKPWWREQFYLEENFGYHQLQLIVKLLNEKLPGDRPHYVLGTVSEGWRGPAEDDSEPDAERIQQSTAQLRYNGNDRGAAVIWVWHDNYYDKRAIQALCTKRVGKWCGFTPTKTTPEFEAIVNGWGLEKRWQEDALNHIALMTRRNPPGSSSENDILRASEGHFVRGVLGPKNKKKKIGYAWVELSGGRPGRVDQGWVADSLLQEVSLKENGEDNYQVGIYSDTLHVTPPRAPSVSKKPSVEPEALRIPVQFFRTILPIDKAGGTLAERDAYRLNPTKPGTLLQFLKCDATGAKELRDLHGQTYKIATNRGLQRLSSIWGLPVELPVIGDDLDYTKLSKEQFNACVKAWGIKSNLKDARIQEMTKVEDTFTGMGLPLRRLNAPAGSDTLSFYKDEIVLVLRHVIIEHEPKKQALAYVMDYEGNADLVELKRLEFVVDNSDMEDNEEYEFPFSLVFQRQSLIEVLEEMWQRQIGSPGFKDKPWKIIADRLESFPYDPEPEPTTTRARDKAKPEKAQKKEKEKERIKYREMGREKERENEIGKKKGKEMEESIEERHKRYFEEMKKSKERGRIEREAKEERDRQIELRYQKEKREHEAKAATSARENGQVETPKDRARRKRKSQAALEAVEALIQESNRASAPKVLTDTQKKLEEAVQALRKKEDVVGTKRTPIVPSPAKQSNPARTITPIKPVKKLDLLPTKSKRDLVSITEARSPTVTISSEEDSESGPDEQELDDDASLGEGSLAESVYSDEDPEASEDSSSSSEEEVRKSVISPSKRDKRKPEEQERPAKKKPRR